MKLITEEEIKEAVRGYTNPAIFKAGVSFSEEKMKGLMVEFANAYAVHVISKKSTLNTPMEAEDFLQKFVEGRK